MKQFIERNVENAVSHFRNFYEEGKAPSDEVLEKYFREIFTVFTEGFMISPEYFDTLLPVVNGAGSMKFTITRTDDPVYIPFVYRYDDDRVFKVRIFDGLIAVIPDQDLDYLAPQVVYTTYDTAGEDTKRLIQMSQEAYYLKTKKY